MKKRISIVFALTLAFLLVMTSAAMAETGLPDGVNGKVISNVLEGSITVGEEPSEEKEVANIDELKTALTDDNVKTINITGDISSITETILVDRSVTIKGNNKTLSFTDALNEGANGKRNGLLVTADGVTIENLNIKMTAETGWQGVYGIQVYGATNVTINGYTGSGGDAALLVNGSTVTLNGTINVSDNEFGGIEVSGDTLGIGNLSLDVNNATIENTSEAPGKPTIWEDKVSGHVKGIDEYHPIRVLKYDNDGNPTQSQVQYYKDKANSQFIELKWVEKPDSTTDSTFEVSVSAKNNVAGVAIPNVLYIIDVQGGNFEAVELVNGEEKQKLGEGDGYWYWGNLNGGFTFDFREATTTFKVTAEENGKYNVKIYAVQLEK